MPKRCFYLNPGFLLGGLLLALPLSLAWGESAPSVEMLSQGDLDLSGNQIQVKVTRVNLPKGYKSLPHETEASGPRYVHKGRVRLESNGTTSEYGPGQVFWEEGGVILENISEGEVELISFGVLPKNVKPVRNKK